MIWFWGVWFFVCFQRKWSLLFWCYSGIRGPWRLGSYGVLELIKTCKTSIWNSLKLQCVTDISLEHLYKSFSRCSTYNKHRSKIPKSIQRHRMDHLAIHLDQVLTKSLDWPFSTFPILSTGLIRHQSHSALSSPLHSQQASCIFLEENVGHTADLSYLHISNYLSSSSTSSTNFFISKVSFSIVLSLPIPIWTVLRSLPQHFSWLLVTVSLSFFLWGLFISFSFPLILQILPFGWLNSIITLFAILFLQ